MKILKHIKNGIFKVGKKCDHCSYTGLVMRTTKTCPNCLTGKLHSKGEKR